MRRIFYGIVVVFWGVIITAQPVMAQSREISKLADTLSRDYVDKKGQVLIKKYVGVLPFENNSETLQKINVGATASSMIEERLSASTIFILVERKNLDDVLEEMELSMSGLVKPENTIKIGDLSGAEILIAGTVSEVGDTIRIEARMVESETGEIISSRSVEVPAEDFIAEARERYFSSFQSQYGLAASAEWIIIFPADTGAPLGLSSINVKYRLSRHFQVILGYSMLNAGGEIKTETYTPVNGVHWTEPATWSGFPIARNYNVSGSGPKLGVTYGFPIFRWLNSIIEFNYIPLIDNTLEQDIAGFPVWITDQTGASVLDDSSRLLVTSTSDHNIPHLFVFTLREEFLISKRVSLSVAGGYVLATTFIPEVYEIQGVRHWMPSIDDNGTYAEYHSFNFSRDKDGERIKFNFSGFHFTMGLSAHF